MNNLDRYQKLRIQNVAISTLIDEFQSQTGKFPELSDLPNFLYQYWENRDELMKILMKRNKPISLETMIGTYPDFWKDLWENVQLERIPRSKRPDRNVS